MKQNAQRPPQRENYDLDQTGAYDSYRRPSSPTGRLTTILQLGAHIQCKTRETKNISNVQVFELLTTS